MSGGKENSDYSQSSFDELSTQNLELILKPLNNPLRLKLLLMLADGPITYTEILERMNFESGSFYWHLGKMKQLVVQNDVKEYSLSDFGKKAHELLTYSGTPQIVNSPFRPNWYYSLYLIFNRIFHAPTWILLQQIVLILLVAGYLFSNNGLIQLGTITVNTSKTQPSWTFISSAFVSTTIISLSVILMQLLYIRPDKEDLQKSLTPLIVRIFLSSSLILFLGIILSSLHFLGYNAYANNPFIQLMLSFLVLTLTIISTTIAVDGFLDLGLKDSLLIVLPPYYVIVLISFFTQTFFV